MRGVYKILQEDVIGVYRTFPPLVVRKLTTIEWIMLWVVF